MTSRGSIVIVGAGPTGLSAAVLLRQRGYQPIVLDRRPNSASLPAAHVANTRTMEVFAEMGIHEVVLKRGDPNALSSVVCWVESMAGREYGVLPILGAAKDERGPLSAFKSVNIPQNQLEQVLLERLIDLGGSVQFGADVTNVDVTGNQASLDVKSIVSRETKRLECDWLLGCDGAASVVRRSIGITMDGPRTIARFMTVYFNADLDRYREGRRGLLYWIGGRDARGVFISFDAAGRTWAMLVPIGDLPFESFTEDSARSIVYKAVGSRDVDITVFGLSSWNMSAQVAQTYRCGPVLLAGDACHRFPPTGGLGMNTGIQDVQNLVWKLDAVMKGLAPPALLDTYEQERRPIARRNSDQSVHNLKKMGMIDEALGIATLAPIAADAADGPIAAFPPEALGIDGTDAVAVARRAQVKAAIDEQTEHFAQGAGIDLGYAYEAGAFIPDGSAKPSVGPCEYRPDAHPGARLPYAPLMGATFAESTLGFVASSGVTLFVRDGRWLDIAVQVSRATGVEIKTLLFGRDFIDAKGMVANLFGIAEGGAVAARPDRQVLWRTPSWPHDAVAQLTQAARVCYQLPDR